MDSAGKLGLSDVPDYIVWGDMMGLVPVGVVCGRLLGLVFLTGI